MNILVLNGSPRQNGNTAKMVTAFCEGAESSRHMRSRASSAISLARSLLAHTKSVPHKSI